MTSTPASAHPRGHAFSHRLLIRWRETTYAAPCALPWVLASIWCLGLVLVTVALVLRKPTPRHLRAVSAQVDDVAQQALVLLRSCSGLRLVTPRFVLLVR